uniref:Uncharacterized protein n=1 Tax=Cajanus cajan TaxID=3821 RepID=A0A151QPR0_CAJCA|nr:hypothetical protein KK1_047069 [Cajanus cajan]
MNSRKSLVVADPTCESVGACNIPSPMQWSSRMKLILLHIENPTSWHTTISTFLKTPSLGTSPAAKGDGVDFLEEMKHACKTSQPKMKVRTNEGGDQ